LELIAANLTKNKSNLKKKKNVFCLKMNEVLNLTLLKEKVKTAKEIS
jgi:hypothetical protein